MNITQEGEEQSKIPMRWESYQEHLERKALNDKKVYYNRGEFSIETMRKYFEDLHYNKTEHKDGKHQTKIDILRNAINK